MGTHYSQISLEERCEIARLQASGQTSRQIAASLDRAPSTIVRELKRHSTSNGYKPVYAHEQAHARRWTGSRLDRDQELREYVRYRLEQGWSPEQAAGRLAQERGKKVISYESIYRFVYAQITRTNDYSWRHLLPQGKSKRGRRKRGRGRPARLIALRRPFTERPQEANDRRTPGHWEGDLMLFGKFKQAVLTLHERHSRLLVATRPGSKHADPLEAMMRDILAPFPPLWRRTVTFDNGSEFARHHLLHGLGIETFFCDTHSPWQKGGVENAIGRMRRSLPRKTDLTGISEERFTQLIQAYNNTPRKCLGYLTPAEVFWNNVLHFKCESTFQPALERRKGQAAWQARLRGGSVGGGIERVVTSQDLPAYRAVAIRPSYRRTRCP